MMAACMVHIRKPYGTAAICGVNLPHVHGGPKSATCLRCLAHPVTRDWGKRTDHTAAKPVRGCWCEACADGRYRADHWARGGYIESNAVSERAN
jgi:hypothetical protein